MILSLLLATSAHAGDIALTRGGAPGVFVYLDGELKGKLTKKEPMTLSAADGTHELWISWDDQAFNTACHGTIDLAGTFTWDVAPLKQGCEVLKNVVPEKTASHGSTLEITKGNGDTTLYSVEIDGKYANGDGTYNVPAGPHTIVVNAGAGQERHQVCMGILTTPPGGTGLLMLSALQCAGFDNDVHLVH